MWSVGCSTGDEPYGLAMVCRQASCDVEILATDINPSALERAQRGRYSPRNLRHVDDELRGAGSRATVTVGRSRESCGTRSDFARTTSRAKAPRAMTSTSRCAGT